MQSWKVIFRTTLAFRTTKQLLVWGCNGHKLAIANPNQQVCNEVVNVYFYSSLFCHRFT